MRSIRRLAPLLVTVLAVLPTASAAAAKGPIVTQVYVVYQKNGKVPPCTFTASQLKDALRHVTPDIKQYAPDFEDAIKVALEQRASGACDKSGGSSGGGAAAATGGGSSSSTGRGSAPAATTTRATATAPAASTTTATSTPQPAPTVDPAPAVADDAIPAAAAGPVDGGADDAPAPLLVLALLIGALLVVGAVWWAVRWLGFDPPWLARWRHASQEAGWRASSAWSEFTDWVRLGR